ncbi:hypothetical protein [Zwartia sp.]|uniref:hypothetical protein n=1 Tax=Zwartia sp. TaxID=2978004 RepID=UPI003BAE94E6
MQEKLTNIFDPMYVGHDVTDKHVPNKVSEMKEFLKSPIAEADIDRYGKSKPYRVVVKANIKNG